MNMLKHISLYLTYAVALMCAVDSSANAERDAGATKLQRSQDENKNFKNMSTIDFDYSESCPEGFIKFGLLPDCYLFSIDGYTFFEAHVMCRFFDADLIYFDSRDEHALVRAYIEENHGSVVRFWNGLHRLGGKGNWSWSKPGVKLDYTNWAPGEPSTNLKNSCSYIANYHDYAWLDISCHCIRDFDGGNCPSTVSTRNYAAICKVPPAL